MDLCEVWTTALRSVDTKIRVTIAIRKTRRVVPSNMHSTEETRITKPSAKIFVRVPSNPCVDARRLTLRVFDRFDGFGT